MSNEITIQAGYRPGIVGASALMHANYYCHGRGFGSFFEAKVAAGFADLVQRLDKPVNQVWSAVLADEIVGTIAIDGEDLQNGNGHLRFFIVGDAAQGAGAGKALLKAAIDFCDAQRFPAVELWTVQGLEAARRLYERHGFELVEEFTGTQWGSEMVEQRFIRKLPA